MLSFALDQFRDQLQRHPHINRILIAYSGGVDSHVLLHAILNHELLQHYAIHAHYVNHGLHTQSDQWQQHCQQVCAALDVSFSTTRVMIDCGGDESLEALAREHRYQALYEQMDEHTCLITAHHQDDQAETFLLQLCRGAGVKGLASMSEFRGLNVGYHARPLLSLSRAQLEQYANAQRLQWIVDDSNESLKFDRNFLRHQVIPLIKSRYPAFTQNVARSAAHCAASDVLLTELATHDHAIVANGDALSISALQRLTDDAQRNLIRYWLRTLDFPLPSTIKLEALIRDVVSARVDAQPCVQWADLEVRRHRDQLIAQRRDQRDWPTAIAWTDLASPLSLPNGTLVAQPKVQGVVLPKDAEISIRFRKPGMRFHPANRLHSQTLKKLFQEWQIPSWKREQIPLLFCNESLAMVVGYAVAKEFYGAKSEDGQFVGEIELIT